MHYCTCSVTSACSFIVLFLNVLILGNKKVLRHVIFARYDGVTSSVVVEKNFCGNVFFFFWRMLGKTQKPHIASMRGETIGLGRIRKYFLKISINVNAMFIQCHRTTCVKREFATFD